MNNFRLPALASVFLGLFSPALPAVELTDLLPLQNGYTVVTCSAGVDPGSGLYILEAPVVGIFKTSDDELAATTPGPDSVIYDWKAFHNEEIFQDVPDPANVWNGENLGEVFGLTLDDQEPPNIYVTATNCYKTPYVPDPVWPSGEGPGSVYRLDGTTGAISSCIQLPSISNAALGNICFHRDENEDGWLYISNLEDGFIYRVSQSSCEIEDTFAHPSAPADDGLPGPSQFGRRIWGLAIHEGRLFYHLWHDSLTTPQEIWSVALNADGSLDSGDAILEFIVPPYMGGDSSPPVSDIDFDDEGTMYLSERGYGDVYVPHNARILKATGSSGSYVPCPEDYYIVGTIWPEDNSAGGVAADCQGRIWASANSISDLPIRAYGMASYEPEGNADDASPFENSYVVDYDGLDGQDQKNQLGEVDIYRTNCECLEVEVGEIDCPEQPGDTNSVELLLTNLSSETAVDWEISPCPQGELPSGAFTILENQSGLFSPLLESMETQAITTHFASFLSGETVCFNLTLRGLGHQEICTTKLCVELPDCDCFSFVRKGISCLQENGEFKWETTIVFLNETDWTANNVLINPLPDNPFTPISVAPDGGPVAPGETGIVTFLIESSGDPALMPGDEICFEMTMEIAGTPISCTRECCLTLPFCLSPPDPDKCILPRRTPCCPGTDTATVPYTICNNSDEERIYTWGVQSTDDCDWELPPGSYSPPGESIIIPANTCVTRIITIDCSSLAPGACAAFEVCFQRLNPTTGPIICCPGVVYSAKPGQLVAKLAKPDKPITLPWGKIEKLPLVVSNPSSVPLVTELFLTSDFGNLDFGQGFNTSGHRIPVSLQPSEEKELQIPLQLHPRAGYQKPLCLPFQIAAQGQVLTGGLVSLQPNTLAIEEISLNQAATQANLQVRTLRGKSYQLQSTKTLSNNSPWSNLGDPVEGADLPFNLSAPLPQGSAQAFFRLIEVEP